MVRAFVGIGSNMGDREALLERAVEQLGQAPGVRVLRRSQLHETDPVGPADQPKFLNGVVELETELAPLTLLHLLLAIENSLGRVRGAQAQPHGPRTVDLDLLLYGDLSIREPDLEVPHPRIREREFVLAPLSELEPDLVRKMRKEPAR